MVNLSFTFITAGAARLKMFVKFPCHPPAPTTLTHSCDHFKSQCMLAQKKMKAVVAEWSKTLVQIQVAISSLQTQD